MIMLLAVTFATSGYAQFEKGTSYLNGSLTGLGLTYSDAEKFNFGFEAKGGYFCQDSWMLLAQAAYTHSGKDEISDYISAGAGARYYFVQNGLFLGVNVNFIHAFHDCNDIKPGAEFGYSFFVNKVMTIEPSVFYEQSFRNHSDYSKFGFKLGLGFYF